MNPGMYGEGETEGEVGSFRFGLLGLCCIPIVLWVFSFS